MKALLHKFTRWAISVALGCCVATGIALALVQVA